MLISTLLVGCPGEPTVEHEPETPEAPPVPQPPCTIQWEDEPGPLRTERLETAFRLPSDAEEITPRATVAWVPPGAPEGTPQEVLDVEAIPEGLHRFALAIDSTRDGDYTVCVTCLWAGEPIGRECVGPYRVDNTPPAPPTDLRRRDR